MSFRIAYMTGRYPRGTDTFIQREVAALRQRGAHVQTLSIRKPGPSHGAGDEQEAERRNTFYVLPPCPWELIKSHAKLLARSPGRYFSAMRLALRTRPPGFKALIWQLAYFVEAGIVAARIRARGLTHLHNHLSDSSCSVAMIAAELGGFSFSFTMHGPAEFFEPQRWRLDEKLRRALFVCCISNFCRSQGMIFAPPDKWDRMHIVHCGVDPDQFPMRRHSGAGDQLLFVGRLTAEKGAPVLLEAVALLARDHPSIVLTVVGDGPDRQLLESVSRQLQIENNTRFLGFQSQAQIRQLLSQTDVFAMASFAEGVPVVLMEAMAAGVPVVATRIAGIPELVEDGRSGRLVPPGNPAALARAIEPLLADASLRNRMAAEGRDVIEREFNLAHESERLCRIMSDALSGQRAPVRPALKQEPDESAQPPLPVIVGA